MYFPSIVILLMLMILWILIIIDSNSVGRKYYLKELNGSCNTLNKIYSRT